jgi:hypothetical protein
MSATSVCIKTNLIAADSRRDQLRNVWPGGKAEFGGEG